MLSLTTLYNESPQVLYCGTSLALSSPVPTNVHCSIGSTLTLEAVEDLAPLSLSLSLSVSLSLSLSLSLSTLSIERVDRGRKRRLLSICALTVIQHFKTSYVYCSKSTAKCWDITTNCFLLHVCDFPTVTQYPIFFLTFIRLHHTPAESTRNNYVSWLHSP